jgi:adenosylcobinamide-GDP ribazoletransferase
MQNALAAFKFLVLGERFTRDRAKAERVGLGSPYFPFVGLILGVVLAISNRVLEPYLESEILAVVLVTLLILMTRAAPLAGTQKTFDISSEPNSKTAADGPIGIYGLLAILLLILFKIRSIEVIGETRSLSLLLTPVFGRWSLVIFLYGSTSAIDDSARHIAENVRAWHLIIATAITLGVAVFFVGSMALWIGLCLSVFALLSRGYLHWRSIDITCNHFGALIELSETLSFALFASL